MLIVCMFTFIIVFTGISHSRQKVNSKKDLMKAEYSKEERKKAATKVESLLSQTRKYVEEKKFQMAFDSLESIISISKKYSFSKGFLYQMMDYKIYTLQLLKRFDDALKLIFELEKMSAKLGRKKSPWNYLKIADCYLGMGEKAKGLKWMGKAVYERGFIKFKYLQSAKSFSGLKKEPSFIKMIKFIKDKIGLDNPSKDFSINLLDGSKYNLSDRKGKVVLIDFWDVKCPPCVKAFPELQKLNTKYREKGFEIIGISLDTDKKLLKDFLDKIKPDWMMACSYDGWKDETAKLYGISATPSTWLVDRKGILRNYNLRGEELDKAIEVLVNQ